MPSWAPVVWSLSVCNECLSVEVSDSLQRLACQQQRKPCVLAGCLLPALTRGGGLHEDHSLLTHSLPPASTEDSDSRGNLCTPGPGRVLATVSS